jgi:hypothetical protein
MVVEIVSNQRVVAVVAGEVRTSIKAGTKFNVTWHLGYPHQVTHLHTYIYSRWIEVHFSSYITSLSFFTARPVE